MIKRPYWLSLIHAAWSKRPLVWLSGVRRVGKTTLTKMLAGAVCLNCDLPSDERRLEDPEHFLSSLPQDGILILDEIHRLKDPSRVMKIAADVFPRLHVLATGSSTLAATGKFRDSLTGRKTVVNLTPVLWTECADGFSTMDLDRRLLNGGLPEQLLAEKPDHAFFSEWLDGFYARDIQELFGIRERTGFLNLLRLMLRQSGGTVDYSALSRECDLSRPTVKAHLEAMSVACALFALPPFHGGGRREQLKRPKVYAFDTGFVSFVRGSSEIRDTDRGLLWEHLVLDALRTSAGEHGLGYWRDKSGREVDFVLSRGRKVEAFECKINPDRLETESLRVFRGFYPDGDNFVVSPGTVKPYVRTLDGMTVHFVGCRELLEKSWN
ncbi:MAG: ATP-binding protein [Candidatus Wallbacteria bacterium]|nr:ATP-binding protein [Candidatus Wallbacteria bacterium]